MGDREPGFPTRLKTLVYELEGLTNLFVQKFLLLFNSGWTHVFGPLEFKLMAREVLNRHHGAISSRGARFQFGDIQYLTARCNLTGKIDANINEPSDLIDQRNLPPVHAFFPRAMLDTPKGRRSHRDILGHSLW